MHSIVVKRLWNGLAWVALGAIMVSLPACGGEKPSGTVKGTVKFKGETLKSGMINFYDPANGAGNSINIEETGTYQSKAPIAAGKYKVFVNPPVPEQRKPGEKLAAKPPFPPILPKYQDPGQTPLTAEVKVGPNEIPIEIPEK